MKPFAERLEDQANELANELAMPVVRSMYYCSRTDAFNEFVGVYKEAAEWAYAEGRKDEREARPGFKCVQCGDELYSLKTVQQIENLEAELTKERERTHILINHINESCCCSKDSDITCVHCDALEKFYEEK